MTVVSELRSLLKGELDLSPASVGSFSFKKVGSSGLRALSSAEGKPSILALWLLCVWIERAGQ